MSLIAQIESRPEMSLADIIETVNYGLHLNKMFYSLRDDATREDCYSAIRHMEEEVEESYGRK